MSDSKKLLRNLVSNKLGLAAFKAMLATTWSIPEPFLNAGILSRFHIVIWDNKYLRQEVRDGKIQYHGKTYHVTWIDFPTECYKAKNVAISLRACDTIDAAYALVRVATDEYVKQFRKSWD